jgi:DNA-dependent RNA polymerase auxiliary subunit epsilon
MRHNPVKLCLISSGTDEIPKRKTPLTAYVEGTTKVPTRMVSKKELETKEYAADLIESLSEFIELLN